MEFGISRRLFPANDYFVSIDADVVAFDFKRDFPKQYLKYDVVFYERYWNGEVAVPHPVLGPHYLKFACAKESRSVP